MKNFLFQHQKIKDNSDFVLEKVKGDISFKDVFFAYNKELWVLKGINFDVEAGKTLALVGETGAGKTSVTNVLNRFYDIQKGSINIDSHSIQEVKLSSLREQIAFVQQEVFLFSDSIFNNITLYDEHISIQKVEEAELPFHQKNTVHCVQEVILVFQQKYLLKILK